MGKTDISVLAEERAIVATRIFDAPRELVFDVSTKPEHIVRWFGCDQMTMPVCEVDLRPGGQYRYVTQMPGGVEFPLKGEYLEVVRPERIVHTQIYDVAPYSDHVATVTLTFADEAGKTKLTNRIVFPNEMSFQGAVGSGMAEGMGDAYDRLEAIAGELDSPVFTISRTFNAPRDLVFKVWSEGDHLARWWGPKGCEIRVARLDVRPGGIFHYAMALPGGHEMWGKFVYNVIEAPEMVVFTNSFSDAEGGITRAPFNSDWPLEVRNVLTLTEENGKTTLTLRGGPINASAAEKAAFAGHFASMEQGFGGTFDQLAEYLAEVQAEAAK